MKNILIFGSIIFLLLTACGKENNAESLQNDIPYVNKEQTQYDDKIVNKKSELTIEDICYYIFTDLNVKWDYSNLEALFKDLQFTKDYIIKESIVKNTIQSGKGFFHIFEIEHGQYKIRVSAFSNYSDYIADPKIYRVSDVEIEIDDDKYLDLFPYDTMEDYINDDDFGEKSEVKQGKDNIYYIMRAEQMVKYGDDRFGYSDLVFSDGMLKSIRITRYTP